MTDTNDKLKMPPGFRWEGYAGKYGELRSPYGWVGTNTTEERAIKIAQNIVGPAVEAATAELRRLLDGMTGEAEQWRDYAERERTRAEKAEALLARVTAEAEKQMRSAPTGTNLASTVRAVCRRILAAASRGEGE